MKIDTVYPHHAKSLETAGIAPKTFPTFKEIDKLCSLKTKEEKEEMKKLKDKRWKRQTFFCIGVSQYSLKTSKHPPMHAIIKKLRDKYKIK